ncbi:tyrosyl-DNA phosphodiesterase domain-containing protein [Aaosphaeria arxii CBS 175.79]|uniref:Tyrosyl-DNA phosphodiesterase domain-containing protein n=1 Tax=Aaosphaeria arxii CBS 175.79 TaxID=1450172 RepID=A0A6A5XP11_9PLEO|nr:tyrosyl-DNA phosphodiesterase domain-containing protein [Aaosphaeria arxii CBS 175.79]KAF2014882.1 tyrosyl-DNA phosphodiesterase domain-containing protein [Aaosphaeria arxii CBS 175.79]
MDISNDDDEDLRRAIALSLQDVQSSETPPPKDIIVLDDDDDDEDEQLRLAMALSMGKGEAAESAHSSSLDVNSLASQSTYAAPSQDKEPSKENVGAKPTADPKPKAPFGILGLDRKAMEQERLARLGKRKRSISPERSSKKEAVLHGGQQPSNESHPKIVGTGSALQYPRGTIKRTWAVKHPRKSDITIEEVFQASTLNIVVISAFQPENEWVFSKIPPERIKQIWIMSAKGEDLRQKLLAEVDDAKIPNFKLSFPSLEGQAQNMHSKLMLLFHDTHLRIVLSTANMMKVDWGETGNSWQPAVLENSVFLIDLPRRADGGVCSRDELTPFGADLMEFASAQELGRVATEGLRKFDYDGAKDIAMVHSIPGPLTGEYSDRTGLAGLSRALRQLGLDDVEDIELDYAASSLGAIKPAFLLRLYQAARGVDTRGDGAGKEPTDFLDRIRIYFPSQSTVNNSTGGPDCGGVITLSRRDYLNDVFPKRCMREYKSTRPGVLSHNKMLLARGRKKNGKGVAWVYVGSANLSESAWGSRRLLKTGKEGKVSIRNWEAGVVVPVPAERLEKVKLGPGEVPPMSVFEGTVEIPFEYPGEEYGNGNKQPWFYRD